MIVQVVAMVSTGLLTILVAIVILCVSGLVYLFLDYFKERKSSKEEQFLGENEARRASFFP
jgi:hypothetical protein